MIRPLNCPICRRELTPEQAAASLAPFCGERCRNVDLLRWSTGRYAIVETLGNDEDADVGPLENPYADET